MKQQINYIISQLQGYYPDEELRELAYWIIEESTGMTRNEILIGCKDTKIIPNIEIILQKLRAHTPVQYIFGHTEWMGLDLKVTPATLIPRPETAELVEWILQSIPRNAQVHVIDIGTGTGCIAIALKQRAPLWHVIGLDISSYALEVARQNAQRNDVEVEWIHADILSDCIYYLTDKDNLTSDNEKYDIIVSNPPYICEKEKKDMDARVLDYEPHTALFVPDNDPLLFYRRIASLPLLSYPTTHYTILFFEINEAYGEQVCDMMRNMGYTNVELKHDMYGKARMVSGRITRKG